MTMHIRDIAAQAAADGTISPEEVLILRRASWSNGKIEPDEADAIFAINDRVTQPTAEWVDYFVEALAEFVVNSAEPRGYVDDVHADWLIAHVDRDGKVDSMAELELIAKVLEKAVAVPARLADFALAQIERAVLTGEGPTRLGFLQPGSVTADEARLLRRALFAQASDRPAGISRAEAEALFRIKDASLGSANAPEWKQLFVQGVGNYLMAYTSYEPLSRERAAELDEFMNAPSEGIGGFFSRAARIARGGGFAGVFTQLPVRDHDAERAASEIVTDGERAWLDEKMNADGQLDEFELALLGFLGDGRGA